VFASLVIGILFFQLLPLDTGPRRWAGPDLILAFACAWSFRRPEYVPIWSLAALFLLADLMLQRPPGLWAAVALLGCENLKTRARGLRDGGFASEWLVVCIITLAIAAVYRLGMIITFVTPPSLGLSIFELAMTMICYPLVVAVTHGLLGVRKASPGELDAIGGRS
jgi:rod shape-determining protein MreD